MKINVASLIGASALALNMYAHAAPIVMDPGVVTFANSTNSISAQVTLSSADTNCHCFSYELTGTIAPSLLNLGTEDPAFELRILYLTAGNDTFVVGDSRNLIGSGGVIVPGPFDGGLDSQILFFPNAESFGLSFTTEFFPPGSDRPSLPFADIAEIRFSVSSSSDEANFQGSTIVAFRVPEPATLPVIAVVLTGLAFTRRRNELATRDTSADCR